jgi:Fe2+ transport system protein B
MNQTTDSMDEEFESTTEEMDQEFEENVQEAQEEWEAYNQELQEQFDQDQEEYEANREEILKIIDKQQGIFERIFGFFAVGGVLITIFAILIIVLSLGGLIFDIVMIIDCLNREFKDKTLWLIILIGGGLIGLGLVVSVVYYFAVKRKLDSDK